MISYVKIFGPPVAKAIKALERIAVNMPQVCIMDTFFVRDMPSNLAEDVGGRASERPNIDWVGNYFSSKGVEISRERCRSIISKSGESLGEYDFYFEWHEDADIEQRKELIAKIDEALKPLGCYYKISTKK